MTGDLSIVTPSYHGDLDRCRLLCETMDRYCAGYAMHSIVVDDEDRHLFAPLAGPRREIVASSALLPRFWPIARWRGRLYRWRPGMRLPIYGWHFQQMRKIAYTLSRGAARVICVDSDIAFCRPVDFSAAGAAERTPLFVRPSAIEPAQSAHVRWRENAYRSLGLPTPPLPGDDFIGPMITWERASVRAMTERMEAACGRPWWETLARQRDISEYLVYGTAVANDPALEARHERISASPCLTYWTGAPLDEAGVRRLIDAMEPHQYGLTIQSHTGTPIETVRAALLGA